MRVALVRRRYRPDGGVERQMDALARGLIAAGHEVHLVAAAWDAGSDRAGLAWHRVPIRPRSGVAGLLAFALVAPRAARGIGCDVVYSFDRLVWQDVYRAGEGVHRAWLSKRGGGRIRLRDRLSPLHRLLLHLESRTFGPGGARRIVVNSDMVREEIMTYYRTPAEAISLVHNGVDLERFHPANRKRLRDTTRGAWGIGAEDTVVAFVGSGFERKGLGILLEGMGILARDGRGPGLRLVVAGKGDIAAYSRRAAALGLGDRVRFVGVVAEVERVYAAADALALPTWYDPFANACLEAMAAGLPVVTSEANGASSLIAEGESGYVLKSPVDSRELAGRLGDLLDPERRRDLGSRAREQAEAFPWTRTVAETVRVLEGVAEGR